MARYTEDMFLKALEIFYTHDKNIDPLLEMGMNKNSAKDTLYCFNKLLNGELHTRNVPIGLIEVLLGTLQKNNDQEGLANVIKALDKKYEYRSRHYKESNKTARNIVEKYRENLLSL